MDPQTAWDELIAAYKQGDWPEVEHRAFDLLEWLLRGGFPPNTGSDRTTPAEHKAAAREFCIYAYATALNEQGRVVDVAYELKKDDNVP